MFSRYKLKTINKRLVQIIPTTQHILENYQILTAAEKNRLWEPVMTKATVYRSPDSKRTGNICPNLPK
ncbi:MAG: hypothetical protein ACI4PO_02180 [Faecousia sp.]